MPGHSQNNRFFGDNGTGSSDPIALKGKYKYLSKLNATETKLGLAKTALLIIRYMLQIGYLKKIIIIIPAGCF